MTDGVEAEENVALAVGFRRDKTNPYLMIAAEGGPYRAHQCDFPTMYDKKFCGDYAWFYFRHPEQADALTKLLKERYGYHALIDQLLPRDLRYALAEFCVWSRSERVRAGLLEEGKLSQYEEAQKSAKGCLIAIQIIGAILSILAVVWVVLVNSHP